MAKKEEVKEVGNKNDISIKYINEVIENLQTQLKDYKEKTEHFKTMSNKAEGTIEVLLQLVKGKDE